MRTYRSSAAVAALAALTATVTACDGAGNSGDDTASTTAATSTTTSTAVAQPVPARYTLIQDNDRNFRALVTTADSKALNLAWQSIRTQFLNEYSDGGYFVQFDCQYGDDPDKAANRLANAKVAVGALGGAQTGLAPGKSEFKMNKNARCGEDPGFKATYDREAPLAEQAVVDICRERIDEEYTVEQVPATLRDVKTTTAADGKWTVTGTAQGTGSYGVDAAEMVFTCTVWKTDSGTVMRDLPRFKTQ